MKLLNGTLALAGAIVVGCGFAATAAAQTSVPAGPWITPDQEVSLEGFESYEQLVKKLIRLEGRSKGVMELESVGVTNQGRDVWLAKLGNPANTPVLIITQQHGNEPHGTEAAVELIQKLISGGSFAQEVLGELFVLIVPRVNPDGSELFTRGNSNFATPPRDSRDCFDDDGNIIPSQLNQGRGTFSTTFVDPDLGRLSSYDINRYHWPDWSTSWQVVCNPDLTAGSFDPDPYDPALNPVPEARAVRAAYDSYAPIWVIDVHNQGSAKVQDGVDPAVGRAGRLITGSILWPTNEEVHPDAVDFSKQITLVMKKRSQELGNMEFTNYLFRNSAGVALRGGGFPGIARNAYGLLGSARIAAGEAGPVGGSILVEIRGQGQKSIGMLKNNARELLEAVLRATADGSLFDEDPAEADLLLPPGDLTDEFIGNPRSEEAEAAEEAEPE